MTVQQLLSWVAFAHDQHDCSFDELSGKHTLCLKQTLLAAEPKMESHGYGTSEGERELAIVLIHTCNYNEMCEMENSAYNISNHPMGIPTQVHRTYDDPVDPAVPEPTFITAAEAIRRAEEARAAFVDAPTLHNTPNNETSVELKHFIGDVKNKKVLITDDLTESGGTLIEAANACKEQGAAEIYCSISHGCFTKVGVKRLVDAFKNGLIKQLFVSNSVKISDRWIDETEREDFDGTVKDYAYGNITVVDVAPFFATAIKNIHNNESVSDLFK